MTYWIIAIAILAAMRSDIRALFTRLRKERTKQLHMKGVAQGTISKIENLERYKPGLQTFLDAIAALDMKPSEFFKRLEETGTDTQSHEKSEKSGQSEILPQGVPLRLPADISADKDAATLQSRGASDATGTEIPGALPAGLTVEGLAQTFAVIATTLAQHAITHKQPDVPVRRPGGKTRSSRRHKTGSHRRRA